MIFKKADLHYEVVVLTKQRKGERIKEEHFGKLIL